MKVKTIWTTDILSKDNKLLKLKGYYYLRTFKECKKKNSTEKRINLTVSWVQLRSFQYFN